LGFTPTFQKGTGKAVVLAVGLWAARQSKSGPIHIHITGTQKFHTTVTNDPGSERYHRTLFRDLRKLLIDQNAWPFGAEGAEKDATNRVARISRWQDAANSTAFIDLPVSQT
jgi:hypothetical protein